MPEYELIQQRNISGKGILKVPIDTRKNRAYILYSSVFRRPLSEYENRSYNPPRSRYGTLVFLRDGFVVGNSPIEYRKQVFDGVNDISGQTLLALKCAYEGVLESIYRLSVNLAGTPGSIGLTPVNYTNGIADYLNLRLAWDECRLVCYAGTAIQLSLYRLVYDVCVEVDNADITPPIPDPITDIPPGTPIEGIDTAYDEEDDDGNTVPFEGDGPAPPPPPLGEECQAGTLRFTVVYTQDDGPEQTTNIATACYGPVDPNFRLKANQNGVLETMHRGNPFLGGCQPLIYRDVCSLGSNVNILSWSNITFP